MTVVSVNVYREQFFLADVHLWDKLFVAGLNAKQEPHCALKSFNIDKTRSVVEMKALGETF